ncbi:tyrosine-type recombinase/integrase [Salibacterium qingdaonense]|uniref:Phage integrase family protein n=1 Tax=Salibacterium qingdaonense TaxID=266892 RepID=A0A1I4IPF5_9BACI|nr:tyrosine-type recombinase/integrase [Salibacterium qingdaonense]SFL55691.1 Phage integrase family protein [Salibacterium qingdaonense]
MNSSKRGYNLRKDYTKNLKTLLIRSIGQLGSFQFEDNSWYYSKKHNNSLPKGSYTIPFHQVPHYYKDWVKYYALLSRGSVSHTQKNCYKIADFLQFISQMNPDIPLQEINRAHINGFEHYLRLSNKSENTKQVTYAALQDFFMKLSDFSEMTNTVPTKDINPFKQYQNKQLKPTLPKEVLHSWDQAMKDETLQIPLEFRTMYWLLRSYPNRISEVLSMKRDCLKSFYSEYTIQIPTFKQSGGYQSEEQKIIPVAYAGHGRYVVDLIRKLQRQTEELINTYGIPKNIKSDYLFIVRHWSFVEENGGRPKMQIGRNLKNSLINWKGPKVNALFKQLSVILDFRSKQDKLVVPTTHQFRHHAVTDRMYTIGYTTEQVRRLTGHKNESMTKYYTHQLVEQHKTIHQNISGLRKPKESPVEFRGKILNLDERTTKQLAKDQRRYLTWEANGKKGVGICSDIAGCNPKGTSIHFECYACDWFVPKLEYYEDYKAEHAYWKDVVERTAEDSRRAAHFENAIRNVSYVERILSICENGMEYFKEENVQKKLNHYHLPPDWE